MNVFGGLIPKISQKLAKPIRSASGAKEGFQPESRKKEKGKKLSKLTQISAASNSGTYIGMHVEIAHVSLSELALQRFQRQPLNTLHMYIYIYIYISAVL